MDVDTLTTMRFAGNELYRIAGLFGIVLAGLVVGRLLQYLLKRLAESPNIRAKPYAAATLSALSRSVLMVFFVMGLRQGLKIIVMTDKVRAFSDNITSVLNVIAVSYVLYCLVDVLDAAMSRFSEKTENKLDDMLVPMVRKSLRVTIVVLALVQVADVLSDEPITTLLAGLGVGGLAVALAAQETIKNFFGSLVILGDKPFQIGDRIVVDGHDGPVEEVGFRSTKIRTLDGHLVTVPNGELANKTIQNISGRPYIKRVANITVTYDTPPEKVHEAVDILKDILENHEGMDPEFPPRVYFSEFNDCSLNILVIYWYHPPSYWDYLAFTEKVNHEILRRFNEAGIEFAFPTQTLYLAGDPSRPLSGARIPDA